MTPNVQIIGIPKRKQKKTENFIDSKEKNFQMNRSTDGSVQ